MDTRQPPAFLPYLVLGLALVAVSHGAIFARLADAAPLAIAAWRVGLAALVVVPLACTRPATGGWPLRETALALAAGAALAVHFATWIASLEYTSVARSVLLVNTAPVWVALMLLAAGRGAPPGRTLLALVLALAGVAVVGSGGGTAGGALTGDLLALAGAVAMAAYLLLAQRAQRALAFRHYLAIAWGASAAILWLTVAATGTRAGGYDSGTWAALAAMAVVSQLLGHGGCNWALRHLGPVFVAVVLLGEPVIAALLAWSLLGEGLGWRTAAGGLLVLAAIATGRSAARAGL